MPLFQVVLEAAKLEDMGNIYRNISEVSECVLKRKMYEYNPLGV